MDLSNIKDEQLVAEIKSLQQKLVDYEVSQTRSVQLEEALRKTELQQQAILNNIPDMAWLKDKDSRFICVNEPFGSACGFKPQELVGKTDLDIWPHDLAERYRADDREVMESSKRKRVEEPLIDKDGKQSWIETVKTPILNEKGEVIGTTGIARDITERKKIEEKLRETRAELEIRVKVRTAELAKANEELHKEIDERKTIENALRASEIGVREKERFLSNVFSSIHDGISILDTEMRIVRVNAAMEKWYAHAMPLVGKKCYEAYHCASEPCKVCPTARTLSTKEVAFEVVSRKGEKGEFLGWQDLYSFPLLDAETGQLNGVIEYVRDITERKKAEEMLKASEARYRAIVEDQTELICRFLPNGIITFVNDAYCRYFGKKQEDIIGKSFMPLIPQEDRKKVQDNIAALSRENPLFTHEHRVITGDGTIRWHQWTNRILYDEQGNLAEFQAIGRDISHRKDAEEKLKELNSDLLRSNKRLRQMSLTDSHTGLYNHRYLEELMESEFYRARRFVHPLSIIMIDIDYFKSINDVYGHDFGDLVLKQFSRQLKRMVRRYDAVVRFGGEEFVVLSPGIDRPHSLGLAQRLLDALTLCSFGNKKHSVKLKVSMAVSSYPEDRAIKGIDLINLADQILNKAKEYGGNRVYSSLDIARKKKSTSPSHKGMHIKLLHAKIERLTKKANEGLIEAIFALAKTIELKDHYTGEHVENTVYYAIETAKLLGIDTEELELVRQAAMLHDLGKIGISEKILLKRSKLTAKEFEEIKKHPQIAADILRPIHFMHALIPYVFYHHERWDGKGYPTGIKGEDIPVGARIIAISDVFQALTSDRPYRKAFSRPVAIQMVKDGSGTQFDPRIVNVFLKVLQQQKVRSRR